MAKTYGTQSNKVNNGGGTPAPGFHNGTVRCFAEQVTLASQASADTISVGFIPKGAFLLYGVLETDTSLSTATVAIGNSTTAGKYRAAATFTATDTPTFFGITSGVHAPNTADEEVILTITTAALPASGNLKIMLVYVEN